MISIVEPTPLSVKPELPKKRTGKKVAVIGSGPAGHSAAYQLARLGYKVTILEKSPKAGGLNRGGIPDWVLPQAVLDREIQRLEIGRASCRERV